MGKNPEGKNFRKLLEKKKAMFREDFAKISRNTLKSTVKVISSLSSEKSSEISSANILFFRKVFRSFLPFSFLLSGSFWTFERGTCRVLHQVRWVLWRSRWARFCIRILRVNPQCLNCEANLRADFRAGDEDSNFSVFRVRRSTEWPEPLHWIAFPVETLTKPLIHWIASPLFTENPFFFTEKCFVASPSQKSALRPPPLSHQLWPIFSQMFAKFSRLLSQA